tara:strand:- start:196 stop:828 length:633 start_codon:yes stop_codon:yes gene_type:complete
MKVDDMTARTMTEQDAITERTLGDRLATLRQERGLTLKQLSDLVDIPVSTLSKVQNHQATLTYANLQKLARGLSINIAVLFDDQAGPAKAGRRTIIRRGQGGINAVDTYQVEVLGSELLNKSMHPGILDVPPASPQDLGKLARHPGEEFIYVLEGGIILYTEDYKPVALEVGDSAYLDSSSGHRFVSKNQNTARLLVVCSNVVSETAESM